MTVPQNKGKDRNEQRLALVCGLDDPVRRRLYDYVSAAGQPVGRDEAAAAAGIGRPLAAYHLDRLVSLGLLTADYKRSSGRTGPGAGRPAKRYARSGSEFVVTVPPREYELAAQLLADAVESDPSGSARAALRRAAHGLGTQIGRLASERRAVPGSGREIMRAALAEHGFEPFSSDDGTMGLRNCPFHALAARHTEVVCGMNLALLEGIAAGIAAQDLQPVLDPAPGRCCVAIRTAQRSTRELNGAS
jgi:predicted ArsR family transcriptional regulator